MAKRTAVVLSAAALFVVLGAVPAQGQALVIKDPPVAQGQVLQLRAPGGLEGSVHVFRLLQTPSGVLQLTMQGVLHNPATAPQKTMRWNENTIHNNWSWFDPPDCLVPGQTSIHLVVTPSGQMTLRCHTRVSTE